MEKVSRAGLDLPRHRSRRHGLHAARNALQGITIAVNESEIASSKLEITVDEYKPGASKFAITFDECEIGAAQFAIGATEYEIGVGEFAIRAAKFAVDTFEHEIASAEFAIDAARPAMTPSGDSDSDPFFNLFIVTSRTMAHKSFWSSPRHHTQIHTRVLNRNRLGVVSPADIT
jgi:hypothetical protein